MLALIIGLPLLGFLINGFLFRKSDSVLTGMIGSLAVFGSFLISIWYFWSFSKLPLDHRVAEQCLFSWMQFGGFNLDFALRVDALSLVFCLVITGVGTLIHVYSIGYMAHDETPGKFFAFLNLFCFAMLVLVLGASLPVLFLGWEGVGLCSYLLIGYWYTDDEKAKAGKKAFVVNRIGDVGVLIGMFMLFNSFGTLDFESLRLAVVQGNAQNLPALIESGTLTAICLLLFLGCTGKSAQIPLYVWLPDAMAGPTPVSALIHAATMVTSGIYLLSRLHFLYFLSPIAMHVVAITGVLTALFAGSIALAQTDIKKVLAYSTVSQLGYMFLACGVGAFDAGVFHVVTHAFFKALLFLGAGSVIHGMHEEQNILKMGGLRKKMPKTYFVFLIAWLAICGIPPFSGFFSKDEILWKAFSSSYGGTWLWVLGVLGALLTAFYMTRLFVLIFLGEPREHGREVHESPASMIIPLQILAVLSVVGGFIGIPHSSWLEHYFSFVIPARQIQEEGGAEWLEILLMGVSVLVASGGVFFGFKFYRDLKFSKPHSLLFHKWFVDEIYELVFIKPIVLFSQTLWKEMDIRIVDRVLVGLGLLSNWGGQNLRWIQTGAIQTYMLVLFFGLFIMMGYLIYGLA